MGQILSINELVRGTCCPTAGHADRPSLDDVFGGPGQDRRFKGGKVNLR